MQLSSSPKNVHGTPDSTLTTNLREETVPTASAEFQIWEFVTMAMANTIVNLDKPLIALLACTSQMLHQTSISLKFAIQSLTQTMIMQEP